MTLIEKIQFVSGQLDMLIGLARDNENLKLGDHTDDVLSNALETLDGACKELSHSTVIPVDKT